MQSARERSGKGLQPAQSCRDRAAVGVGAVPELQHRAADKQNSAQPRLSCVSRLPARMSMYACGVALASTPPVRRPASVQGSPVRDSVQATTGIRRGNPLRVARATQPVRGRGALRDAGLGRSRTASTGHRKPNGPRPAMN